LLRDAAGVLEVSLLALDLRVQLYLCAVARGVFPDASCGW
jgi:hypothetical protein